MTQYHYRESYGCRANSTMSEQDHDLYLDIEILADLTSSLLCISDSRVVNQVACNKTRNQHVLTVAPLSINSPLPLKYELRTLNRGQETQNYPEVSHPTGN